MECNLKLKYRTRRKAGFSCRNVRHHSCLLAQSTGKLTNMRITDYTRLPLGTKTDGGEVKTCTHCGKPGLAEEVDGKTYFTHVEAVGFNQQGSPEMRWDYCPPPKTAPESR
jgi:hypothetical protein